ncbi:MAG: phenylalanine--tRNA ligase subunit beta [Clostridia bacterium]|nr:phenylalanine--tRNA ligase subunit beta [Clostridia bacterium]
MKVSLNWIKDFVDFDTDAKTYADVMTATGTKVEGYEILGEDIQNVVVGRIDSTEKHPDADRLTICSVSVGKERPVQIVTGATNIKAGDIVPVCLDGALLPGGKKIKAGKLRGVLSEGMLCSIEELGVTLHEFPYAAEDGILIIEEPCEIGQDIREALMLSDTVVDFELTFNRPDCLAFIGIARETAASFKKPFVLKEPKYNECKDGEKVGDYISVDIQNPVLCPRYSAAVVKNVKIAPSPLWLRMRLRAAGVRPINNIVDITNYVMLEYGQPMHAFDYSYISSHKIVVRNAKDGEEITTLDGNKHPLNSEMLCIADGEKPVALAGIMGGLNSEILDTTATVVFESANFNRSNIRHTSRAVGLRTESSGKFEKGLPPYNTVPALKRALELVEQLGCGDIVEGIIDVCNADIQPRKIKFDAEKVNALLGTELSFEEMAEIMKPLELIGDKAEGTLLVPPYRSDMERTADIAEEVSRLYGFDKIQPTLFKSEVTQGKLSPEQSFTADLKKLAVDLGFFEIATYSFVSPKSVDRIMLPEDDARRNFIKILNPLGEDTSVMRTTAIPSMLEVIAYNKNRKAEKIALFECAKLYFPTEDGLSEEKKSFVLASCGNGDFYDLKGCVESIFDSLGIKETKYTAEAAAAFHPGICASVKSKNKELGVIGAIHPAVAAEYSLPNDVYLAVLDVEKLFAVADTSKKFVKLPAFPSLTRDLALVMDKDIEAGVVAEKIRSFGGKTLESIKIFDVYTGKGVDEGKKSVAYNLVFRAADKTMSDADADTAVAKILKKLENEMGIVLR